jgi:hypothetical protein
MTGRSLLLLAIAVAACTDRSSGEGVEETSSSTATSAPPTSSDGWSTELTEGNAGSTAAETTGNGVLPYPDCRDAFTVIGEQCEESGAFGGGPAEAWSDFACEVCLCAEPCDSDDDCFDPGAVARPRCLTRLESGNTACFLECESDGECPPEMVCTQRTGGPEQACYWAWLKPLCCSEGGGNC